MQISVLDPQEILRILRNKRSRFGVTLIELLVVVAIIGVLVSILVPAIHASRVAARRIQCVSQLRQIGLAMMQYMDVNDGRFPRSSHSALAHGEPPWGYAILPFLEGPETDDVDRILTGGRLHVIYRCPEDRRDHRFWSYGKNVWFELGPSETGEALGIARGPVYHCRNQIRSSSRTVLVGELETGSIGDHIMAHFWLLGGAVEVAQTRHGSSANYLWVDGHVSAEVFSDTFNLTRSIDRWNPGGAILP